MRPNVFLFLGLTGLMFACAPTTKLTNTWIDPSLTPGTVKPFKKALVVARIKDDKTNRKVEDKIVAKINMPALPSYAYLLPTDTVPSVVNEKLKKNGFDGLISMQLTDVDETVKYQQGTTYYGGYSGGYYGGYHGGYPGGYYGYAYSTPGYYTQDRTYYVTTSIISLDTGKLMWSGTTATVNPTQLDQTLDEIILSIRNELIKKGLIKKPN